MAVDSMDSSDGDSPTIRDGAGQQTFRDQGLESLSQGDMIEVGSMSWEQAPVEY